MVDDMDVVSSVSSRKMEDKEETTPEASWDAVTGRKEKEVETPEVIVFWSEPEGVLVNPDGEGHREQAQ